VGLEEFEDLRHTFGDHRSVIRTGQFHVLEIFHLQIHRGLDPAPANVDGDNGVGIAVSKAIEQVEKVASESQSQSAKEVPAAA